MEDSNTLKQSLLSLSSSSSSSALFDQYQYSQGQLHQQYAKEKDHGQQEKLSVDQILEEYVRGFGRAQLVQVVMVSLAWAFDSLHTLITIFSDVHASWRCVDSLRTSNANRLDHMNATLVLPYLPFQKWCTEDSSICEMDPSVWEWVEGKGASVVSEWGLICDNKFKASIPASLFFVGCILGILGTMADFLGRKRTLILSCLIISVSGFLTALAPNIWVYASLRLISGFGRAGVGICSLILSTESVGRKWRGQIGLYGFFFFAAGLVSLPGIAYITRSSWRNAYMSISALSMAYCCIVLPFIWESPRWLTIRGRTDEALRVLRKMVLRNNKSNLPENIGILRADEGFNGASVTNLLRLPWTRRKILLAMAAGVGVGLVYYGMPLNIGNLNLNPYISVALNGLMELPAIVLGSLLLPRVDRRLLVSASLTICSVCCILCAVFAETNYSHSGTGNWLQGTNYKAGWVQMLAEMVGFLGSCAAFDFVYIFTLELFATDVRGVAVAMLRQSFMAGAAMAPVIVVLGRIRSSLSFFVFGGFAIVSAFLTLLLPETRNHPIYETSEQQHEDEEQLVANNYIGVDPSSIA